MARRTHQRTIKRLRVTPKSGQVCVRGQRAHANTADGLVYATPSTITTLIPIGYFTEDMTGDDVLTTVVELFEEIKVDGWDNAAEPNDVQASDVFTEVYLADGTTVTTDSTSHSKAGRVMFIEDGIVYVQAGLAVAGPTGDSGSALSSGGVASRTALKAVAAASRFDGQLVMVRSDGSLWRFVAASTQAADGSNELVLVPDAGTGRWVRADKSAILKLPIGFGTADGADLILVPAGMTLRITGFPFWEVTTAFAGGAASAIGLSTTVTGYDTKGDVLGGATGDVEAGLTAGIRPGTVGAEMDLTGFHEILLVAGAAIEFDRITSVFTSGAGFACVPVSISTDG